MTKPLKDGDVKPEDLFDVKTFGAVYTYRIRSNGAWLWVCDDSGIVLFANKADRDRDMAVMKARLAAREGCKP